MKAIYLTGENGGVDVKAGEEIPAPCLKDDEILVQVRAAGVTPTELDWYPTTHSKTGELRQRPILGHEFSGIVTAVGTKVTSVAPGDEVFGMNDWYADGAMAEFCVTQPCSVAPKPFRLSHAEAASVPIGALTAWQGLFEQLNLLAGDRILVQGGAGAVGVYAVQLAHRTGAYVVATASPDNFEFLRELGANEVVDYHSDYFSTRQGSFDAVFDVVGGETLKRSWSLLKPGGQLVTIAPLNAGEQDETVKRAFLLVEPNQRHLLEIAAMLDAGELRAVVDTIVPLSKAIEAYVGNLTGRTGRGKVVVELKPASPRASAAHV